MSFADLSCSAFMEQLASSAPVPGGGGASALAGAIGTALGNMVGSLTVGKKKYADVEEDIIALNEEAAKLRLDLLEAIDRDAQAFEPLSKAYGIPKDDPARAEIMENALLKASEVPLEIMRTCAKALELIREYADKGSRLAVSDAGVGAALCKAAILGASLNVFINTKSMVNRDAAEKLENEADCIIKKYCSLADEIYMDVLSSLR